MDAVIDNSGLSNVLVVQKTIETVTFPAWQAVTGGAAFSICSGPRIVSSMTFIQSSGRISNRELVNRKILRSSWK